MATRTSKIAWMLRQGVRKSGIRDRQNLRNIERIRRGNFSNTKKAQNAIDDYYVITFLEHYSTSELMHQNLM